MRKLMWFVIGFAGACSICVLFLWNHNLLPWLLGFLLIASCCFFAAKRVEWLRIPAAISLGLAVGTLWYTLYGAFYLDPIADLDGRVLHLSITASGYAQRGLYGYTVEGYSQINGKPYRVLANLKEDYGIEPGDTLKSDFRVRVTTPEGNRSSAYYQGDGIFLVVTQKSEMELVSPDTVPVWSLPPKIAESAKQILQSCFPEDTAAFSKAILLGDTSDLSYEEDTVLKASGIRHVVAVSGLHVSFVLGLILFFCRRKKGFALIIAVPVLLLFAAITGFSPSVCRACLMSFLMLLGAAVKEEYDGLTGLSFACLLMMVANPYIINSVSFQMSVSSVLGILMFASPIHRWVVGLFPMQKAKRVYGKLIRWLAGSVSVSASALVVTVPISAYYFGTVSLLGIFTNLLTIWAIGIVFCGIAAVCVVGTISIPAGTALAGVVSWIIRYVQFVARIIARIPFAAVYVQSSYTVFWLYVCYGLLLLFLVFRRRGRLLFAVGIGTLIVAILLSVWVPRLDSFRLTVMNIGEGQCILIQSGGQSLLVDCGGDSDTGAADFAAQTLLSQGIQHLDAIALTHYDRDHAGAVDNLLTRVSADIMYCPALDEGRSAAFYPNMQTFNISENTQIPFGDGTLTLSAPDYQKSANENCMCILFESPKCDILITGDRSRSGEKRLIETMNLPDVDILIAGHHGAKSSTSYELLQTVKPEIVIISAGEGNSYGHPAAEMLARLEEFHCTVFRTDQQGTILVRR